MSEPKARAVRFGVDVALKPGHWAMLTTTNNTTGDSTAAVAYGGDFRDVAWFDTPALCVDCKQAFPSGAKVSLTNTDIAVEQPVPCPECGGDGYVPENFTIQDTAGHFLTLRRLDLLRRTAQELLTSGLSNDELVDLADRLRGATDQKAPAQAVRDELASDRRTRGLIPLTQDQRDLLYLVELLLLVIATLVALRPSPATEVNVGQVIVQAIEDDAIPQPRSAKVGRNEPCPCGSGQKFKRCHGP